MAAVQAHAASRAIVLSVRCRSAGGAAERGGVRGARVVAGRGEEYLLRSAPPRLGWLAAGAFSFAWSFVFWGRLDMTDAGWCWSGQVSDLGGGGHFRR